MKALKLSTALLALCSTTLLFGDEKLEDYISETKKEQFRYDYQKNEADGSKLRDSWIAPLNLNYSYSKSNPYGEEQLNESASIKMDQSIFQSGGIYYGIKFAEASKIYADYSVDVAKRKLIKDAVALLMQIKQMDLKKEKQHLLIKNAEISLAQKKEDYLNGQLDSGFLDSAIIERNQLIQALYDIETNKERLISKFRAISDLDYANVTVPHLRFVSQKEFLEENIALTLSQSQIEKGRYFSDVTMAKYLPKVNFVAGYNWDKSDTAFQFGPKEKDYYNFGFRVNLPLDINSFRDMESSKIDYMKSKIALEDKKREQQALYEQVVQNIQNLEKKKQLSAENRDIYERLLADTKQLFEAGYKAEFDVELMQNSLEVQKSDVAIYEIDRQLELLTLYEMYQNEI